MYNKGELETTFEECTSECDENCYKYHRSITDSRTDDYDEFESVCYLPHSCDEWIIGKKENVVALIEDLQAWLKSHE